MLSASPASWNASPIRVVSLRRVPSWQAAVATPHGSQRRNRQTSVSGIGEPADIHSAARSDDMAFLQTAKELRNEHPQWVIIWVSETSQYHAYPLFRTRRDISVRAAEPADLIAQLSKFEQATHKS
jgi:hypothetical protein